MARKKKPVDRTPICDPAYLRRIDPVWMPGPVPFRFWQDRTHRRDYLIWLAHRLGLRTMEDFYGLKPIDDDLEGDKYLLALRLSRPAQRDLFDEASGRTS